MKKCLQLVFRTDNFIFDVNVDTILCLGCVVGDEETILHGIYANIRSLPNTLNGLEKLNPTSIHITITV